MVMRESRTLSTARPEGAVRPRVDWWRGAVVQLSNHLNVFDVDVIGHADAGRKRHGINVDAQAPLDWEAPPI